MGIFKRKLMEMIGVKDPYIILTMFNRGYDLQQIQPTTVEIKSRKYKGKDNPYWDAFIAGSDQCIKEQEEIQIQLEAQMTVEQTRELDRGRLSELDYRIKYGPEIDVPGEESYDLHKSVRQFKQRNKDLDNDNDLNI